MNLDDLKAALDQIPTYQPILAIVARPSLVRSIQEDRRITDGFNAATAPVLIPDDTVDGFRLVTDPREFNALTGRLRFHGLGDEYLSDTSQRRILQCGPHGRLYSL